MATTTLEVEHNQQNLNDESQLIRAITLGAIGGVIPSSAQFVGPLLYEYEVVISLSQALYAMLMTSCILAVAEYVAASSLRQQQVAEGRNAQGLSPFKSGFVAFSTSIIGASLPTIAGLYTHPFAVRLGLVLYMATLALGSLGYLKARLGNIPNTRRVVLETIAGGWFAMTMSVLGAVFIPYIA